MAAIYFNNKKFYNLEVNLKTALCVYMFANFLSWELIIIFKNK